MTLSQNAQNIYDQVSQDGTKLGDLRKIAKELKKDHHLAMELWSIGEFMPMQLAILIMDKKILTQEVINALDKDIQKQELKHRTHLIDWLMANQLAKDKKLIALMESWEESPSKLQRRLFWYYQARLRWMGNTEHDNTDELLKKIESGIEAEKEEVQWAMNFTAGWIGVYEDRFRDRCISIGKNTGLYSHEKAPPNCTPNYLPEFIRIEVEKRK